MNWVVIFTRGQATVDILPTDWQLDGAGMAVVAGRLEGRLRDLLGPEVRLPRVVMSDRGTGMYASNGQVVGAYAEAIRRSGFRLFWGADASRQAADMPDLLLHETVVSWLRSSLRKTKPVCNPWLETPVQWSRRMMLAVDAVNAKEGCEALANQFMDRVDQCFDAGGDRLDY